MSRKITIPAEYEAEVLKMIAEMQIKDGKPARKIAVQKSDNTGEVKKVLGHDVSRQGNFSFRLRFADGTSEWVNDEDTNCEWLISEYLHSKGILTTYVYCRVSSKNQVGEDHVSLPAQESELVERAQQITPHNRVKVVRVVGSAYKQVPQEFLKIAEAAKNGDVVLCYRVDRLSRNIVRFLSLLEDMDDEGVRIFSHEDNIWYAENKLDMIELILQAQKEAVMIGKRVSMSVRKRKERGDETLGQAPFGQCLVKENDGRIVLRKCEAEIELIREVKSLCHMTYEEVAEYLNSQGKLKRGRAWSARMVAKVTSMRM